MGLSGRKVKQRIGHDPRNLSWVDDATRFGSNYLAKFGWESSKGLGASGEGRTTHIKVAQKLDMMGIGAARQQDPNGVAWKQNRDYENLLKRLNEADGVEEEVQTGSGFDGFVKPEGDAGEEDEEDEKKKEKRKRNKDRVDEDKDKKKKKKKKRKSDENVEDTDRKSKKKKKSLDSNEPACNPDVKSTEPVTPRASPPEPLREVKQKASRIIPRHRSHRARHIAAKSIGLKSAAAISEILGIAPSPSSASSSGTQPPQGRLTSIYDDNGDAPDTDKITTSTKTLQDYFKEKMGNAKRLTSSVAVPGAGEADCDDNPRAGLGSRLAPKFLAHVSSNFMTTTSLTPKAATEKGKESYYAVD